MHEFDPLIDQWYWHRDKGPGFYVTVIDDEERTIEVQHYDGDIEEYTFLEWRNLDIELGEEPENWTGAMDIAEQDDLGTEITDTTKADWDEPESEFRSNSVESRGEGYMGSDSL